MANYEYNYDVVSGSSPNPLIIPFGARNIVITCWGGGGCGSGIDPGLLGQHAGGGGGGCSILNVTLNSGTLVYITVGSGGTSSIVNNGGDSYVQTDGPPICLAYGGNGLADGINIGASGAIVGVGDTTYTGGDGSNSSSYSGGGGGGGGTTGNGNDAVGVNGGAAVSLGGGKGGNGRSTTGVANNGSFYGGGGGGAYLDLANGGSYGGNGGDGHVKITFTITNNVLLSPITPFI